MPQIKYNKYIIRNGEKLVIPIGDPPEKTKQELDNLEKYKSLKAELLKD